MKRLASFAFLCLFLSHFAYAQKGKDGSKTVSGTEIVNEYAALQADNSIGDVNVAVTVSDLNANNRFANALEEGDLLMMIQVQGVSVVFANEKDSSWGEISNYNNCGNYEFVEVAEIVSANEIKLNCPLKNDYSAAGKTVLVRVPRYSDLTVPNGTEISGDAWDGTTGGIVSIEVDGDVVLDGTIEMTGKGFRGTASTTNSGSVSGAKNEFSSANAAVAGLKGEGVAGYHLEYDNFSVKSGRYGQGAAANAGGGGCSTDAGGGGGANAGDVNRYSGHGIPSLITLNWAQAWDLEYPGFSSSFSSGGGRGGYSRCATMLNPLTNAPGAGGWGGDYRRKEATGLGGRPLDYSLGKLFLGGGGGQGHGNEKNASAGASGGGLVFITNSGNVSGSGSIESNGNDGEGVLTSGFSGPTDGGGGAGAGGTIVVQSEGTISTITINAFGGQGGTVTRTSLINPEENCGPGGGGGGGYVKTSSVGPAIDISGGANGEMISNTNSAFIPFGATAGSPGESVVEAYSAASITVVHDTICPGGVANLSATGNNLPLGAILIWYDAYSNGNVIGTGTSYSDAGITTDTSFYVGICPGTVKEIVNVKVSTSSSADVVNDTVYACENVDVKIEAIGGVTYKWWPTAGLDDENVADPTANLTASETYYVEVTSAGGCSDTDSVFVSISSSLVVDLGKDSSICPGASVDLTASGGTIYTWSPNTAISSISDPTVTVNPSTSTEYIVVVDDGSGCTGTDTVVINVLPDIVVVSPGNQEVCMDEVVNLSLSHTGGPGGSVTYSWDDGLYTGMNQTFSWNASTNMEVKVTDDTYGCSDSITVIIDVRTLDLDFTFSDTCYTTSTQFVGTETASGTIVSNSWWFYGTNTASGKTASFEYPTVGLNTAKFYAVDDIGCTDSIEKSFTIVQLPNPTIVLAPDTVCINNDVVYTSNYNGIVGATSSWTLGDGTFDSNGGGTHAYSSGGLNYVDLTVTDINGCSASTSDSVLVGGGMSIDFTMPVEGKIGETVTLNNISTGGQIYTWRRNGVEFDDAFHSTLLLDTTGTICIELHSISQAGCMDSVVNCIEVLGEALLVPNIFTPNNDGTNDLFELMNSDDKKLKVQILNRWGIEVYASNEYLNDWDGKDKNGTDLAEGTYFYVVIDETGVNPIQYNGFVNLVR